MDRAAALAGDPGPPLSRTLPPIVASQAVIFALFSLAHPLLYVALWILPLVTVFELLNKIRAINEHQPATSSG